MTAIYRPSSIVPEYYAEETASGEVKIYDARQILLPKVIIKPDGRIYRPSSLVPEHRIPLYRGREDPLVSPGFSGSN
jgi:hypothetical protein